MKHYNLDAIKTEMQKDVERFSALSAAWKKVTFPTKKDGKPFAAMGKNIAGAKYAPIAYAMQAHENELTVYTFCASSGYIHDAITLYELVKYLRDDGKKAKTQNYMPVVPYLEQVYKYDLDDIKQAVAERAAYLDAYVEDLKKQLAEVDGIFRNFRDAYAAALKQLENETAKFIHKDAYYAVKDTVLERFPYC